jgi:TonB-linked SusC/RagA family outer membrane protein
MRKILLIFLLLFISKQITHAQEKITITGTIISSEDNLGVIGAAIIVKGTQIGTTADIDGNYKLTVPADAKTLVFSFVGLKSQEIEINGQTKIDVVLGPDIFKMDEVIVAGVASATPKRKLSVSVAKVGADDLESVPAASAATALQGKISGVTIVNAGGPGQSASIRLRSSTSLTGNQSPLIIVDGIMVDGELSDFNVDDIESMEVVKGAAASALYGSRAGNGVISIKTKRGSSAQEGQTDVRVRNEFGLSNLAKEINVSEHNPYWLADDYQQPGYTKYYGVGYPANYSGGFNKNISGSRRLDLDHYNDNPYSFLMDPQNEIFKSGQFYTNYISIANNTNKTGFLLSFENNKNSGIVFNKNGSARQNIRINIDHKINDKIKLSASSLYAQTKIDMPTLSNESSIAAFYDALFMNPDVDLNMSSPKSDTTILPNYFYKPDNWAISGNPKHTLYYEKIDKTRTSILLNLNASVNIFKWLVFDAEYSMEKRDMKLTRYVPVGFMTSFNENEKNGSMQEQTNDGLSQTFQTTFNLNGKFGDLVTKGKISYLFEKKEDVVFYSGGDSLLSSGVQTLSAISKNITIGSKNEIIKAKNYFSILDLDFKEKYIASVLFRYDGSSLFGPENKWKPYYRYSLAYRLGEEIKIPNIQELKLRYSVGTSGQRPGYDYQYETFALINGQYIPYSAANKAIKPSETKETEMGVNIQFFERFEAEITYSFNETKDAIIKVPLSAATGFSYQWQNAATLTGNSFEFTLGTQAIKTKSFEWRLNLSYDRIRQEVSDLKAPAYLYGPSTAFEYFYVKKGETFGVMYGYDWVKSLDQMKQQLPINDFIDNYIVNSDGYVIKKGTEGTRYEKPIPLLNPDSTRFFGKIADMNADFNMSLNSTFTWKTLTLTMLWNWKSGGNVYNYTKQNLYLDMRSGDYDQSSKPDYQKKSIDYYNTFYDAFNANSYFVEDGSYLKLRELSVYYTFGKKLSTKLGFIKGGKIGVLGRNLLTFTNYTGWDPEVASGNDLTNFAVDMFNYPNFRSYTVSLELKF